MATKPRISPETRALLKAAVEPVVEAHGGDAAVSRAVGRDRSTVGRWTKGEIDLEGLRLLASTLRHDITVVFPGHGAPALETREAPPSWWTRALDDMTDAVVRKLDERDLKAAIDRELGDDVEQRPPPHVEPEEGQVDEPTVGKRGSRPRRTR